MIKNFFEGPNVQDLLSKNISMCMIGSPTYSNFLRAKTLVEGLEQIYFKKCGGQQASTNKLKLVVPSSKGETNLLGLTLHKPERPHDT